MKIQLQLFLREKIFDELIFKKNKNKRIRKNSKLVYFKNSVYKSLVAFIILNRQYFC